MSEQKDTGFGSTVPRASERSKRIYVAGPMSGIENFNFPVFNNAAAMLRLSGWEVENPAEHELSPDLEWADYMAYDLTRLGRCGAIYLLPGWSRSKGASIESGIAISLGMQAIYAPGAETAPVPPAGDVEVLTSLGLTLAVLNEAFNAQDSAERLSNMNVPRVMRAAFKDFEQVKAEVTRLTAERDGLQSLYDDTQTRLIASMKDAKVLQSELTKARGQHAKLSERAWKVMQDQIDGAHVHPCDEHSEGVKVQTLAPIYQKLYATLTHQSAPAANFIAHNVDESCGQDAEAAKGCNACGAPSEFQKDTMGLILCTNCGGSRPAAKGGA